MKAFTLLALGAALFSGCAKNNLPQYNKLGDLRILALIADLPEASVGTSVTVTPIISDFGGNGRPLFFTAEACNDPGVGVGATPSCAGSQTRTVLAGSTPVTGLAAPDFTGAATSTVTFTLPTSAFTGASTIQQAIGVAYLFVYKLTAADGANVTAFKRVVVSTKPVFGTTPNTNPTVNAILSNGAAMTALTAEKMFLSPQLGNNAAEAYLAIQGDASTVAAVEELTTTWFVSDGAIDAFRTIGQNAVGFMQPATRPTGGRNVVIISVTRDGRGGESFVKLAL